MWGCVERECFFRLTQNGSYGGAKDADQPWVADDIISVGASGIDAAQGVRGREGEGAKERTGGWEPQTDRKGAITASQVAVKKDHGHGFASVSSNINHSIKSTSSF